MIVVGEKEVTVANRMSKEEKRQDRVRVTGRDPFVDQRVRMDSASQQEKRRQTHRRRQPRTRDVGQRNEVQRRQSMILGAIFALVALAIYVGVQVMAPRMVVNLGDYEGTVIVDGRVAGETGDVIAELGTGRHVVKVVPLDTSVTAMPDSAFVNLGYAIAPYEVHFQPEPAVRDTTAETVVSP